jgi:hypothetical protein
LGILYFLGFVQYLPTPELEIFVGNVHWRQSQEHDRKNKKNEEQILSNFRQKAMHSASGKTLKGW